jgi:gamma-glutamylcyclotransferase (GGCT)/AIG2-like uncharacterized protein YtfP
MLKMKPGCECCDKDLPAEQSGARICSFECTFCEGCARLFSAICPNCGGELVARPSRSLAKLVNNPASTQRVHNPAGCSKVALLFSYGTLQQEDVQLSTFGRLLSGSADALVGFTQSMVKIEDQEVVATSGKTHHPIVKFSDNAEDRVQGTVFEVTDSELAHADAYEVDAYRRVSAKLASGKQAWVYVDARLASLG